MSVYLPSSFRLPKKVILSPKSISSLPVICKAVWSLDKLENSISFQPLTESAFRLPFSALILSVDCSLPETAPLTVLLLPANMVLTLPAFTAPLTVDSYNVMVSVPVAVILPETVELPILTRPLSLTVSEPLTVLLSTTTLCFLLPFTLSMLLTVVFDRLTVALSAFTALAVLLLI